MDRAASTRELNLEIFAKRLDGRGLRLHIFARLAGPQSVMMTFWLMPTAFKLSRK